MNEIEQLRKDIDYCMIRISEERGNLVKTEYPALKERIEKLEERMPDYYYDQVKKFNADLIEDFATMLVERDKRIEKLEKRFEELYNICKDLGYPMITKSEELKRLEKLEEKVDKVITDLKKQILKFAGEE